MIFRITYKVGQFKGIEGQYKTKEIARRHLRKLQKRYTETLFTIQIKVGELKCKV